MTEWTLDDLLPHRTPMQLLQRIIQVSDKTASAEVVISTASPFYCVEQGVPSWIGVEYMGQTAALIAGLQLQTGKCQPHLGLLLGTRSYSAHVAWFQVGQSLTVSCTEAAVVGDGLATFLCEIHCTASQDLLASAKLSVFRKALE